MLKMKPIKKLFILALALLFATACTCSLFSCQKAKKQNRAPALLSLKYNGNYFETSSSSIAFYRFSTLTGSGYKTGYHFDVPCADYFIQNKLWSDSLLAPHNYSDTLIETAMVWQGTNWFTWSSFYIKIDSVSGGQAFGKFSGYLVKLQAADTLFITAGQFNHIPIIY